MIAFAQDFISKRASGLRKDMGICLTDTPAGDGTKITHAYFPALGACCGFLEYMTALHRGRLSGIGWEQVVIWSGKYLPQPDYDDEIVRVLFQAFRHSVAHRGIATGIWVDRRQAGVPQRRITWELSEFSLRPSCQLVAENGVLDKDPPWLTPFTHRMHVHLASLAEDLCVGADSYARDIGHDAALCQNFERVMHAMYPRTSGDA